MRGRTILVTGASRGIGLAIAETLGAHGANVVVAAKTVVATERRPGTITEAAAAVDAAGGQGMAIQLDVRDEGAIGAAVAATVERFGGLDAVVHNAGAIQLSRTDALSPKRYDLMQQVNARGAWMLAHHALPHLRAAQRAHFVTLSPPINLAPHWFANHTAYTISKYAMTMTALGLAAEFPEIGACTLWPRTAIATAAVEMLGGDAMMAASRTTAIMADAMLALLQQEPAAVRGRSYLDEDLLRAQGREDFSEYAVTPGGSLMPDLFVDPESFS